MINKFKKQFILSGWYETELGMDIVDERGDSLTAIVNKLHNHDPNNFGHTDCEFELIGEGFDFQRDVTEKVCALIKKIYDGYEERMDD